VGQRGLIRLMFRKRGIGKLVKMYCSTKNEVNKNKDKKVVEIKLKIITKKGKIKRKSV
jgi:hypothetical protein